MRFPFNYGKDPVIELLVEYAGTAEVCEQAMHNAYHDPERHEEEEITIKFIKQHIDRIKDGKRKKES